MIGKSWRPTYSWFWNAGWGDTCNELGKAITCTKDPLNGAGWGVDNWALYVDGRGYSPNQGPSRIAIITDSGGGWYNANIPNHDLASGVPVGSNTLYLDGRAEWRPRDRLQTTWNGGAWVLR